MIVYIRGHSFRYEMENIARLFTREVTVSTERPVPAGDFAYLRAACAGGRMRLLCYVSVGGDRGLLRRTAPMEDSRAQEYELAGMLYDLLSARFGVKPPWGILTGIRPAKYVSSRREALGSWDAVRSELTGRCHVTGAKTELAIATAIHSQAVRALSRPDSVSLYISIPFCPTRCSYCSFVSKTTERDGGRQLESYVNCLVREIGQALAVIRRLGLRLETVYIGGGTPTVMTAEQLARVLEAVSAGAELAGVREFTVEAGRPDTIDREKLLLLKRAGVSRICINPQTFSDEVLRAIGRRHTAADIDRVFAEARALGFSNINMDLIVGLPGDTAEGFRRSLDRVSELAPEGVTVHALTIKRASTLREKGGFTASPASVMVDDAYRTLTENELGAARERRPRDLVFDGLDVVVRRLLDVLHALGVRHGEALRERAQLRRLRVGERRTLRQAGVRRKRREPGALHRHAPLHETVFGKDVPQVLDLGPVAAVKRRNRAQRIKCCHRPVLLEKRPLVYHNLRYSPHSAA